MKAYDTDQITHHILLESRNNLTISGVEEVESFDDSTITMHTVQGTLIIQGQGLHIEKLSLDGGDLKVEGQVDSLSYENTSPNSGGFWSRLFG